MDLSLQISDVSDNEGLLGNFENFKPQFGLE